MKTYDSFLQPLTEATEGDLKNMGATPAQIQMLKKRQAARGKGFSTGDDRVNKTTSSGPRKALGSSDPLAKAAPNVKKPAPATKASAMTDPLKKAATALAKNTARAITKPADKGASIVRTKQERTGKESVGGQRKSGPGVIRGGALAKRSPDKIVRHRDEYKKDAKQKLASGSAGSPKLSPRTRVPQSSPLKKPNKFAKGFRDEMIPTKRQMGKNLAKGIKSAPGKALRTANAATKGPGVGVSSSGNLKGPAISQGGKTNK
jgi:hypothetical protein